MKSKKINFIQFFNFFFRTVHTEKKSSLIVRKLDFIVPRENSLEEEGVYCLKISKENEGNNRNIM